MYIRSSSVVQKYVDTYSFLSDPIELTPAAPVLPGWKFLSQWMITTADTLVSPSKYCVPGSFDGVRSYRKRVHPREPDKGRKG